MEGKAVNAVWDPARSSVLKDIVGTSGQTLDAARGCNGECVRVVFLTVMIIL